jgi:hypothetical protein
MQPVSATKGTRKARGGHTALTNGHIFGHTFYRIHAEWTGLLQTKNPLLQRVHGVFAERLGRGQKGGYFPIQNMSKPKKAASNAVS